jgi:sugar O-acyltransferase (sialic acid O-acetyltransferase NeuD family)
MSIPDERRDWQVFGVIDEDPDCARRFLPEEGCTLPVLSSVEDYSPHPDEVFVPALGDPHRKLVTAELIESRGGCFINLFHPTALIAPQAKLNNGIFCFANAVISVGAQVDDFVTLNVGAVVGHDAVIGRGCTLSPYSVVNGKARLERGVFIGTHGSIIPKQVAHEGSCIGAGSVAVGAVSAGITVMGVPARPVAKRM